MHVRVPLAARTHPNAAQKQLHRRGTNLYGLVVGSKAANCSGRRRFSLRAPCMSGTAFGTRDAPVVNTFSSDSTRFASAAYASGVAIATAGDAAAQADVDPGRVLCRPGTARRRAPADARARRGQLRHAGRQVGLQEDATRAANACVGRRRRGCCSLPGRGPAYYDDTSGTTRRQPLRRATTQRPGVNSNAYTPSCASLNACKLPPSRSCGAAARRGCSSSSEPLASPGGP